MAPGGTGEISGFNATGDGRAGGNPLVLRYSDDLDATVVVTLSSKGALDKELAEDVRDSIDIVAAD